METLFTALSHAVEGATALAIAAAFAWGLASLLLSPCHLAGVPLIVGFIQGHGQMPIRRAFALAAVFASGIFLTIGAVGLITAYAGQMLGTVGPFGNFLVAGVFLLMGLALLDVVPLSWAAPDTGAWRGRGVKAALALGLIFGVALGPCTFAFMAPVLGVVFAAGRVSVAFGLALVAAFAVGHCAVIVAAGAASEWVSRYLRWHEHTRAGARLRHACGVLVLVGGLWFVYTA